MNKRFAIIGFGSQAQAWALNLRDSQFDFSIGLRKNSSSFKKAESLGFKTFVLEDQAEHFDYFALLIPDNMHLELVKELHQMNPKSSFIYAHGFSLVRHKIHQTIAASHLLLAPKSIASELRLEFEVKGAIPAAFSLEHSTNNNDEKFLRDLAKAIGITYLKEASFEDEMVCDLFSEQSLLCSSVPYLAHLTFERLVKEGMPAELAYFECFFELKSITNAFVKMGPEKFFSNISPNAFIGGELGREFIFDEEKLQTSFEKLFKDIKDGEFFKVIDECDFEKVKAKRMEFWKTSALNLTHSNLHSKLYR